MAEPKQDLSNYKLPGSRGPRGRQTVEKAKDRRGTLRRLVLYFSHEKKKLLGLMICVVATVVAAVYTPRLQSQAIDSISQGRYEDLNFFLILMLAFYGTQSLFTLFQGRLSALLSQSIVKNMRNDLFQKIVNLPIRYLDNHPHGDIMSRMTNDIENVSNTVSQSFSSLVSGALTIIGTVAMMFYLSPQLALLSCATVILTVVATKFLSSAMRKFYRRRQELLGS